MTTLYPPTLIKQAPWPRSRWASALLVAHVLLGLSIAMLHSGADAWLLVGFEVLWCAVICTHFVLLHAARARDAMLTVLCASAAKVALSVLIAPASFPGLVLQPVLAAGYVLMQPSAIRTRLLLFLLVLSYAPMLLAYSVASPGGGIPRHLVDVALITGIATGTFALLHMIARYRARIDAALEMSVRANAALHRTRDELNHLLDVSRAISAQSTLNGLLDVVLEQLTRSIDADTVAIFLVDADLRVTEARTHGYTLSMPEQLREHRRPPLHHLRVLQTGTSILVKDAAERNSDAILVRNGVQSGSAEPVESCASWIGVPLNTQGKTIGLIALSHRKRRQLRRDDALLALAFANQVAAAVDSVRSKEQAVRAAAMTERARLARELHDSVSQALFGVSLGVRTGLELLPPGAESARPISYALELAEAALLEMRALIFEMRPESLREEGLVNALKRQAGAVIARYKAEHGSQLNLNLCDREPDVPLETKEALYRISLEALTNAAKHAKATAITLDMSCDDDRVHLVITDNGRGFDPNALYPGHLGLTTMRERAELFGGNIDFDSAVGHGTRITVTVPHGDRVVTR